MKLNEAKQILKKAGYLIEDAESFNDAFIDEAYYTFLKETELEDVADSSMNITKTEKEFMIAYEKTLWDYLGKWEFAEVIVTSNFIRWKQKDADGNIISNETKLLGTKDEKIEQLQDWINTEWWGN